MTVCLAEGRDDLRHLEAEGPVRVGERGSMALRVRLVSLGGMRPDLDALAREGRPVAGAAHGTAHPEAAAADPLHDRCTWPIVVGAARHRARWCQPSRIRGHNEAGHAGSEHRPAASEEATAIEKG